MSIRVRYFASTRELLGRDEDALDATSDMTVAEVWQLAARCEAAANTLVAVNEEFSHWGQAVVDGDEVAFFPPVTGG